MEQGVGCGVRGASASGSRENDKVGAVAIVLIDADFSTSEASKAQTAMRGGRVAVTGFFDGSVVVHV